MTAAKDAALGGASSNLDLSMETHLNQTVAPMVRGRVLVLQHMLHVLDSFRQGRDKFTCRERLFASLVLL